MRWTRLLVFVLSILTPHLAFANLDLAFVLDTTGSMSAEIREAKERVKKIADALKASDPNRRLRVGVVAFRDRGDAYVTKVSPLSSNIDESFAFLSGLTADGGGDGPEDVLSGLQAALDQLKWDAGPDNERQIFLIGDAPPHLDYSRGPSPQSLFDKAQENGIVINSIGCRSLPPDGIEFFRTVAYSTEGRYQHIGRVDTNAPKLAEAMLDTLKRPEGIVADGPQLPVAMNSAHVAADQERVGLSVQYAETEKLPGRCVLHLVTPYRVAIAAPPEVRRTSESLLVRLRLGPGVEAEARDLIIGDCEQSGLPIRIDVTE